MALAIAHRGREGIEILDLDGRLVFGEEDLQFRNEIDKLLRAGKNRVVLNLARLAEIDTTGLGTLLFALAKLRKEGGGLALVNLRSSHIELLELTKLETVFEVFDDEQEAINSFFPAARFGAMTFWNSSKPYGRKKLNSERCDFLRRGS